MKLLDTDHCVAVLRGKLDLRTVIKANEILAVTTNTVGELIYGSYKSIHPTDNLARLDAFLSGVDVFPFDENSARYYGRLRAMLEANGWLISDLDLQIACIALEADAPLVTHNQQHLITLV